MASIAFVEKHQGKTVIRDEICRGMRVISAAASVNRFDPYSLRGRQVLTPINRLYQKMSEVGRDNLMHIVPDDGKDELGQFAGHGNIGPPFFTPCCKAVLRSGRLTLYPRSGRPPDGCLRYQAVLVSLWRKAPRQWGTGS